MKRKPLFPNFAVHARSHSMSHPPDSTRRAPRADTRRAQIRAAAADCFRRHGFHGTSIAQISKAAGMSTGHIYHYFENKEAIIADIVAQDLERLLTLTAELRSARDVKAAMIERAVVGVEENLDPAAPACNWRSSPRPRATPISPRSCATPTCVAGKSLAETLRTLRRGAGHQDDDATLAGMVEALAAMFEGLRIRAIRNPGLDREAVVRMFRRMVHDLVTQTLNVLRTLIEKERGINLSKSAVSRLLGHLGLSPQRPIYKSYKQDPAKIEEYLSKTFPEAVAQAKALNANIFFVDEASVRSNAHRGLTWGKVGETPVVRDSGGRFGLNVISAISPRGDMRFSFVEGNMDSAGFILFLKKLHKDAGKPILVIADNARYHHSKETQKFIVVVTAFLQT
jgi:AcrR family transcriptional regulator